MVYLENIRLSPTLQLHSLPIHTPFLWIGDWDRWEGHPHSLSILQSLIGNEQTKTVESRARVGTAAHLPSGLGLACRIPGTPTSCLPG